ncbi:hypothetical protein D3C76_976120 [compost metagenome]
MLASDTPRVSSMSGMVMPPSRSAVLASQRGSSKSRKMMGMPPARLMTIGLRSNALSEAAVPEMAMPMVN